MGIPLAPLRPQTLAPYGVMTSPKTAQMHTNMENPKFGKEQQYGGVPQGHNYFPGNDVAVYNNQNMSLEQARYLQRMNNAALK